MDEILYKYVASLNKKFGRVVEAYSAVFDGQVYALGMMPDLKEPDYETVPDNAKVYIYNEKF